MAKPNLKSVRMSDEVLQIVEKFEGEGFNQKFENIVLYFAKTEPERQCRIAELNKHIKHLEQRDKELTQQIAKKMDMAFVLAEIANKVKKVEQLADQAFCISAQLPGSGEPA